MSKQRSIDTGRMDWDSRKKKIIELRKKHANSSGEYDLQDVHNDYVDWLKETPKAIDFDALAAQDLDRADRADRPFVNDNQGELWDLSGDCQIPFGRNMRVSLDMAKRIHFLGWQQILQKNFTDQANSYNKSVAQISEVLIAFEEHPRCKTFASLRKEHEPPAAAPGA